MKGTRVRWEAGYQMFAFHKSMPVFLLAYWDGKGKRFSEQISGRPI